MQQLESSNSAYFPYLCMDGQSDKQGTTRTDSAAIYGRFSDQKESPVDCTPHEDVTRKASYQSRLSTLNYLLVTERERAPSFPVQGYHQEKSEAERPTHGHHVLSQ